MLPIDPVISDPVMKLWKQEKDSWGNRAAYLVSVVIKLSDRLGQFSAQEISYLENLLQSEGNYDPEKVTKDDFLNIKLKHLYSLWLEDRSIYTKEFEILQIQELWSIWLKNQTSLIIKTDKCYSLVKEYNINKIQIYENSKTLKDALLKNLTVFKQGVIDKDKNKTLFQNPAYMIRKAFDLQNVHDYQVNLNKNVNSGGWSAIFGKILESLGYMSTPLDNAIQLLENAATKDQEHSWPAHNALAFMHVVKESPKIIYTDDAGEAQRVKNLL